MAQNSDNNSKLHGSASYSQFIRRKWLMLATLLFSLCAIAIVSITVGSSNLSLADVINTLLGKGTAQTAAIIWHVRLPRIVVAIVVGIALAMAGCIMQNVLRNPLASASTLGVSQGATFGAAFAIIYLQAGTQINSAGAVAIAITNPYLVTLCAIAGGILTTLIILGLARIKQVTPATMVLAGVALSALFSGATALLQYFADDIKVASVVYWTFGDLGRAGWREIGLIAILNFATFIYFMGNRWNYNALEGGVPTAKSLGVKVDSFILISMFLAAMISAVAVAFVGCISFIGLIAPHIVRRFVGNDFRFLIPCSALMGAIVLLLADLCSRTIVSPTILPIGALTSFLGAPLFLYLIFKKGDLR